MCSAYREEARQQLEWEYDRYHDEETDRYIAANAATFEALKTARWKEDRERFSFTTESMAKIAARFEIQKQITFLSFEEFLERKKHGTDLFLKAVALSSTAEPAPVTPDVIALTPEAATTLEASEPVPENEAAVNATPIIEPKSTIEPPGASREPVTFPMAQTEAQEGKQEPLMIDLK